MAKGLKTIYVCGECGYESGKWMGRCPNCDSWNTLVEVLPAKAAAQNPGAHSVPIASVDADGAKRVLTGIGELDRVLGGGVVMGSTVLVGGDPGIGKSTLLMQAASCLSEASTVLYVTGEESAPQLKLRADRIGANGNMLLFAETDLSAIEAEIERTHPAFLVIDSIQTIFSPDMPSAPGSVTQVREATTFFTRVAKASGAAVFLIGHVTKDGAIAGPRMLEHMVDTVLYFEGDRTDAFRLLRTVKNRFGSTNEIGVFEMLATGMQGVSDPSGLFLSGISAPGCAITCAMEGSRPLLAEVQALIAPSTFSNPRRMASGIEQNRLVLLLAVLEKKAFLSLSDKDVYLNVVGGLRLDERASDLAAALCVASALLEVTLPSSTVCIGELSLTGEVRPVSQLDKRIGECARLGFTRILMPRAERASRIAGIEFVELNSISDAVGLLAHGLS